MSRRVWKAVEAKVEKSRMAEAEGGREEVEKREIEKKQKNNRDKESGRRIRDLGWGRRSSNTWRKGQEIGFSKVP